MGSEGKEGYNFMLRLTHDDIAFMASVYSFNNVRNFLISEGVAMLLHEPFKCDEVYKASLFRINFLKDLFWLEVFAP